MFEPLERLATFLLRPKEYINTLAPSDGNWRAIPYLGQFVLR